MLYQSPIGPLRIESRNGGISRITFADDTDGSNDNAMESASESDTSVIDAACHWLDTYFTGRDAGVLPPLSLEGTPFQKRVWNALCTVPYGHTATYGHIARLTTCHSAQAVGQAIHNNPIAILVPCHRIIGANGNLTGYAAGLSRKAALLKIEGILLI